MPLRHFITLIACVIIAVGLTVALIFGVMTGGETLAIAGLTAAALIARAALWRS